MPRALAVLPLLLSIAAALSPASQHAEHVALSTSNAAGYLPVVLWHGMGDYCCADYSIGAVKELIEQELPGVFVHSINTGLGATSVTDILSSYFGSVNDQVARVCDELLALEELKDGYVAVGFSQGGQFLRAVAERCQHMGPLMHTLVTMGAQHQGVANVPGCWEPGGGSAPSASFYCRMMQGLVSRGAYTSWVQRHVVQAQYVKDPLRLPEYLSASMFLADINNEVPARRNKRYHDNLASLQRLVLFLFEDDDMVVPRESSHFGFYNGSQLLTMNETELYQQDWIGLKELQESGRLELAHCPGRHMQFSLEWFARNVVRPYLAVPSPAAAAAAKEAATAAGRSELQQQWQ
ncbi:Palmitoyl- thioesterase 1 [Chlorella sorokiniana]|uniref:Palmitoyl-protein thioesterase 1 n=1 Tax=Chlorella sorokiniana TaxID=3076 RepID=A0A2P6TLI8_CHLSO|nr:Palmitoyl- thioesterase 1 [Chlorella sorokiniana]|eukprot:PRW45157.1 Palmitoyl- thioesterase 1 [Chlorella sorokiniana]